MSVLVLGYDDVERLLPMEECIELMADALAGLAREEVYNPLRAVIRPPGADSLMVLMPAYRATPRASYAMKAICVVPDNPSRGLDAHQGAVLLSDGETGELRAVVNASAVTEIRTAAVSRVATRVLARADARELAVLGAGVQARAHLAAMAAVREFARARLFSRTPDRARTIAEETRTPFPVEVAESAEEAVRGADVVVTATSSHEPVLRREWLAPGTHVNAVGAPLPTARELDTATVAEASLFVDRRESAVSEAGDYLIPLREGAIGPEHIRAELGELLIGAADGRASDAELTVFKSVGIAVEDLVAAEHVYRRARESGAGAEVSL